jgi:hypothetical protein
MYGENTKLIQTFVGKAIRNRPVWRIKHRWEGNIEMDLKEMGYSRNSSGSG